MSHAGSRREFMATTLAALTTPAWLRGAEPNPAPAAADDPVAFFLVGDTHFLANKDDPAKLDERSSAVTQRLVDRLNSLCGTPIPDDAGGGTVAAARGVVHAGDCIDTGDKANVRMQETEWAAFADCFGLSGKDGRLKLPVYEVHGNHDSPSGDGLAVKRIVDRNKSRPGVNNVSKNGVHYSWDWGHVHFVNLGIVVGQTAEVARRRRYAPLDSLEFLVADLRENVGASGRPVVITHHVDVLRYSQPLPVEDQRALGMEWDPADVRGYHDALKGYRIAAVLYGHTHARNVYRWNGTPKPSDEGIPTFNVDNGSHFAGEQQAFFYFEIHRDRVTAREVKTSDAWKTSAWTPQTWTARLDAT